MPDANSQSIDFKYIAATALSRARSLLPQLVPNGRFERDEYVALNPSRADKSLGSFKINSRTGLWDDFAIGAKGNDIIGWYAHAYGLKLCEAARRIAEKLGISTMRSDGSKGNNTKPPPKIYPYGEEGPPVGQNEIRRHYYPKNGGPKLKVKIKKRDGTWTTCYRRLQNGKPVGWQFKKPAGFSATPYFNKVRGSKNIFWPEGERDADTLDKLKLSVFTFGGTGDGLPNGTDHYLELLKHTKRPVVITTDNDVPGRAHAQKKAKLAHTCGIKHIRIFDPATVWPECPEGGDVTDWFKKCGGTREKLIEIVDALPDWQPSANDDDTSTTDDDAGPSWDYPDLSLLDDRRGELPPFPLDVLSATWQVWATNAAHGAGTAVDHVVVPLFGVAASLIGTARRLKASASWTQPLTLWTAIVGYSGTGKTPGLDVSHRALARVEHNRKHLIGELRRAHERKTESAKTAKKQWQERVREAVEAGRQTPDMPADAEVPDAFEAPRLFVSNATIEKLAVLLLARPQGMLLICDELAGLFLNMSRYSGGTDREFWLEAWNGNPHRVERLNRPPVDVEHLLVGLTGGFQPDKLDRSFEGDADGIYARVLFSWPTEAPYRPLTDSVEEIEPEFENALTKLINLAEFEEEKLIIRYATLAPDARNTLEEFRRLMYRKKDGLDGRERDWWAKTPAHVLRLAGTLAYLDWAMESVGTTTPAPTTIDARFVASAARLVVDYFWPHARCALRLIGLTDDNAKARKVLRWLRAELGPEDEVSLQDIRRSALGQSLDATATRNLIDDLVKAGWLREVPTVNSGGRPRYRWQISPLLWNAESAGSAESRSEGSGQTLSALSALSAPVQKNTRSGDQEEATWTV